MAVTIKKAFKIQVQEHILNNLCSDYTEVPAEQLQNVLDGFKNWYSPYEQKRTPNRWAAMQEWLLGLPSELHIEFTQTGIHEILKTWFTEAGEIYKDQDSSKETQTYMSLVIREFFVLCKKYGVNAYTY